MSWNVFVFLKTERAFSYWQLIFRIIKVEFCLRILFKKTNNILKMSLEIPKGNSRVNLKHLRIIWGSGSFSVHIKSKLIRCWLTISHRNWNNVPQETASSWQMNFFRRTWQRRTIKNRFLGFRQQSTNFTSEIWTLQFLSFFFLFDLRVIGHLKRIYFELTDLYDVIVTKLFQNKLIFSHFSKGIRHFRGSLWAL